jgi:hypothetical protein
MHGANNAVEKYNNAVVNFFTSFPAMNLPHRLQKYVPKPGPSKLQKQSDSEKAVGERTIGPPTGFRRISGGKVTSTAESVSHTSKHEGSSLAACEHTAGSTARSEAKKTADSALKSKTKSSPESDPQAIANPLRERTERPKPKMEFSKQDHKALELIFVIPWPTPKPSSPQTLRCPRATLTLTNPKATSHKEQVLAEHEPLLTTLSLSTFLNHQKLTLPDLADVKRILISFYFTSPPEHWSIRWELTCCLRQLLPLIDQQFEFGFEFRFSYEPDNVERAAAEALVFGMFFGLAAAKDGANGGWVAKVDEDREGAWLEGRKFLVVRFVKAGEVGEAVHVEVGKEREGVKDDVEVVEKEKKEPSRKSRYRKNQEELREGDPLFK